MKREAASERCRSIEHLQSVLTNEGTNEVLKACVVKDSVYSQVEL